jgi:hypothetical protein
LQQDEPGNSRLAGSFFHHEAAAAIPLAPVTMENKMKMLLALAGAAVVMSAAPAEARHHRHHAAMVCAKYRHHHCVAYRAASLRPHLVRYRTGYVFGPSYNYTAYSALPAPYVTRYHLSPDYRYVYSGNTIYVVDPTSYAITRIINGIVR